jgi:hypothetical protein
MHKTLKVSILNVDFQDSIPWFSVFLLPTVEMLELKSETTQLRIAANRCPKDA